MRGNLIELCPASLAVVVFCFDVVVVVVGRNQIKCRLALVIVRLRAGLTAVRMGYARQSYRAAASARVPGAPQPVAGTRECGGGGGGRRNEMTTSDALTT